MKKAFFNPQEIIPAFDLFLAERGIVFSAIAIGGAALSILGIVDRGTRDLDLLDTEIPKVVEKAAHDFATLHSLSHHWLNCGPSSLIKDLPLGWRKNLQPLYQGKNLKLSTLGRLDLIRTKLWAMCDRVRDLDDLLAIAPTVDELNIAAAWVKPLDGNKNWSAHVDANVALLMKKLGHD